MYLVYTGYVLIYIYIYTHIMHMRLLHHCVLPCSGSSRAATTTTTTTTILYYTILSHYII